MGLEWRYIFSSYNKKTGGRQLLALIQQINNFRAIVSVIFMDIPSWSYDGCPSSRHYIHIQGMRKEEGTLCHLSFLSGKQKLFQRFYQQFSAYIFLVRIHMATSNGNGMQMNLASPQRSQIDRKGLKMGDNLAN